MARVSSPNTKELKATNVLSLVIDEGSAKVRTGEPNDDLEDYSSPFWAGQLPLKMTVGSPIADSKLSPEIALPEHIANYHRGV